MKYRFLFLILFLSFQMLAQYSNKSVGFIENKGQIVDQKGKENKAVLYLLNTNGLNVQLRKNGFSYDIYETKKHKLSKKNRQELHPTSLSNPKNEQLDYSLEYLYHRIDIDFLNSNPKVELIAEEKSTDYDNYYNVAHAKDGITDVHKFKKVTYKNIYDKIDVVFFIPKDSTKAVEYNFIVRPGGKTTDIQLKFNGAKTELVDNKIKMNVRFGEMEETLPLSWVENGNTREEIGIGYRKIDKNVYGFVSNNVVNSGKTIVIDPTPVRLWGTYYGGDHVTIHSHSIKADSFNNVVFSGETSSSYDIATSGAFQTTITTFNSETGFIAKLDENGVRIWGTYINYAGIKSSVITSQNEIYIGGYANLYSYTGANLLSTPGSHKEFIDNGVDALIMKFAPNGQRIWGTFYGGEELDRIDSIFLDSQENLIIAGETHSEEGISTPGAYQQAISNSVEIYMGFFAKFNSQGNRLYGSYFSNVISYCTIDSNDDIFFAGQQYVIDNIYPNISTSGAYQTQLNSIDGYIVKFSSTFNKLWGTYYGGNEQILDLYSESYSDFIKGIGTDELNNIYIVGTTSSLDKISTVGSYKENQNVSGVDAFVVKFNSNGVRQWGTYYGDNTNEFDRGESCFVTKEGDVYLVGQTTNLNNISTTDSFQSNKNPLVDCYLTKFNTNGQLIWGTYYGGDGDDYTKSVFYKEGKIYLSGFSYGGSLTELGTPGTHKPISDGYDIFIAKFQDCQSIFETTSNSPICIGNTIQLNASGGTSYSWTGPNGFVSSLQNPTIPNANASHSGDYSCIISGTGGCDGTSTVTVVVGNSNPPVPTITPLPTITGDCKTTVTIPTAMSACDGMINGTTSNPLTYSLPGTYTIVWNYTDGNGNTATQNQKVTINSQLLSTATSPQIFCIEENAIINDIIITGQNIKWYDALSAGNVLTNTTLLQNGITYYASQTSNGCESARAPVMINIQNTPAPTGSDQSFCATQNPTLNDIVINGTNVNWYATSTSTSILPSTTILADGTTYYATQTINSCDSTNRTPITITLVNTLNATDFAQEICDDNNNSEIIDLTSYNTNLISNTLNCTFSYYNSLIGAENVNATEQINNPTNYDLTTGLQTIYVRILSNNGCHQIVALGLTLLGELIIPINEIVGLCENSNVTINAGNGFDSYLWSTGATASSITVANAGNYSLTVTKNYSTTNCSSTKNFMVVTSNSATISNIITSDWTTENNTITIHVSNASVGEYEYSLDGVTYQDNNVFYGLDSGSYTVYVRDKNGCGTVKDDVYLLMFRKFFTPNGDTHNDTWSIKFSRFEPGLKVALFDRYGKFIKELKFNESWDGTYNGLELPSTDYWFVVTRADGKEHKGHFTLMR